MKLKPDAAGAGALAGGALKFKPSKPDVAGLPLAAAGAGAEPKPSKSAEGVQRRNIELTRMGGAELPQCGVAIGTNLRTDPLREVLHVRDTSTARI